jgi:hypothetical protein
MIVVALTSGAAETEAIIGTSVDLERRRRVSTVEGATDLISHAGDELADHIIESNVFADAFNPLGIDASYGSRPIELIRCALLEIYIQNVRRFGVFV